MSEAVTTGQAQSARPSHAAVVLRSTLYNALFYITIVVLMVIFMPVMLMPPRATMWLARLWARISVWLLRVICGTHIEFRGVENLPADRAALIAPKHQSFLETFALLVHVRYFSYVLKRELTWIPFFGWYLRSATQIGIDRSTGRTALVQVTDAARKCFARGQSLFIFPEGTRRPIGAPPIYKGGVGFVYAGNTAPCVPVALNTGLFWPRRKFLRFPGHCVIEFLPVIEPGLSRQEFMRVLQERLEPATDALVAEACAQSPWLAPDPATSSDRADPRG